MLLVGILFLSLLLAVLVMFTISPVEASQGHFMDLLSGAAESALGAITGGSDGSGSHLFFDTIRATGVGRG